MPNGLYSLIPVLLTVQGACCPHRSSPRRAEGHLPKGPTLLVSTTETRQRGRLLSGKGRLAELWNTSPVSPNVPSTPQGVLWGGPPGRLPASPKHPVCGLSPLGRKGNGRGARTPVLPCHLRVPQFGPNGCHHRHPPPARLEEPRKPRSVGTQAQSRLPRGKGADAAGKGEGAGAAPGAGRGAHLDSADQSFLPPAMPPSPRPPCARAGPGGRRLTCAPLPRRPAQVRSHGRLSQPARPAALAALAPAAPSGLRGRGRPVQSRMDLRPGPSDRAPASAGELSDRPPDGPTDAQARRAGSIGRPRRGRGTSCSEPVGPAPRWAASSLRGRGAGGVGPAGGDPTIGVGPSLLRVNRLSPEKAKSRNRAGELERVP